MIKNVYLLSLLLCISFWGVAQDLEVQNPAENRSGMIADEMQQEFEMTRDPNTGTIPRERLIAARKYAEKLQKEIEAGGKRNAIPNFTWEERGSSNVGGRTLALLVDANDATKETVFAGSASGGLWKTTNFSADKPDWTIVGDAWENLAISTIEQDPLNTQIIYVGTGEGWLNPDAARGLGIWKSSDGGNTWAQLGATNNANFYYVMKIEVAPNGDVYVGTKGGVYRSKNGGTTFSRVFDTAGEYITDLEISPTKIYLAARTMGIYSSASGDTTTWVKATSVLPPTFQRVEIAVAPSDPLRLYAMFENSTTHNCLGVYKSSDGGGVWTSVTIPLNLANAQAFYTFAMAIDPTDKDVVWAGGVNLFRTTNGGATAWTAMSNPGTVHNDQHFIYIDPATPNNIYFGNDGGIYFTANGKATTPTFTAKNRNYNVTQFYSCAIHPTAGSNWILAGTQDNGNQLFQMPKMNATRLLASQGGDGGFAHIHRDTANFQIASATYNQYYFTRDAWESQSSKLIGIKRGSYINPTDYDFRSNYMYVGDDAGKFTTIKVAGIKMGPLVLTDSTSTIAAFGTAKITAITVSPNTTNLVFVGLSNGDIVKIINAHLGSRIVTPIRTVNNATTVSCIVVEQGNDNHIIITYSNYGITSIYETTNGGGSWVNIESNLPDMPIRWAMFNPNNGNQMLLATDAGVWSTDNLNGAITNWGVCLLTSGLPLVRVNMLKSRASDGMLVAATHGRGIFTSDVFTSAVASFTAENPVIYPGRAVQFVNTSTKSTQWTWNFGDGTTDNSENPLHTYSHSGYYNVNLTINNGASSKTINTFVHVLPYVGTPYIASAGGDFESDGHFDAATVWGEPTATAFEKGNPAAGVKAGTASGSKAWATGLTANYMNNSTAILYSPCFSFLEIGSYTIKFKAKFQTQAQVDGFQVEYSLDKGNTWNLFGTSLLTWYNSTSNGAVFPLNEPFFSGLVAGAGNPAPFIDFEYATTALENNPFVSFRFVFKSDGATTVNGVVIDDFEIDGPLNTPLPVDITEFTGDYKDGKVVLNWHTLTETNSKGFEVQRSLDGMSFEILGWVDGNGSTAIPHSYAFNDNDIRGTTQYYRLKQVDFNGTYEYTDVIQVFIFPQGEANMFIYPNPFEENITIRLFEAITTNDRVKIKLIDKNGIVLALIPITDAPPIKQMNLDLSPYNLASGIYYLEIYANGNRIGSTKVVRK